MCVCVCRSTVNREMTHTHWQIPTLDSAVEMAIICMSKVTTCTRHFQCRTFCAFRKCKGNGKEKTVFLNLSFKKWNCVLCQIKCRRRDSLTLFRFWQLPKCISRLSCALSLSHFFFFPFSVFSLSLHSHAVIKLFTLHRRLKLNQ